VSLSEPSVFHSFGKFITALVNVSNNGYASENIIRIALSRAAFLCTLSGVLFLKWMASSRNNNKNE